MNLFTDFDLLPSLQQTLKEKGFKSATEIQGLAIPQILTGKSVVGVSETGSGKTLAYALPILSLLKNLENKGDKVVAKGCPRAVVVVPTRELGEQVSKVFKPFTHSTRLRVRSVLGGTTIDVAKRNVSGPVEILVGTPGRLVKLVARGLINLSDVRVLVFDEADQMLDQGFLPDSKLIASQCPQQLQLALFSATVTPTVQTLMNELFAKAEVVKTLGNYRVPPGLVTNNRMVVDGKRLPLLESVLAEQVSGGTVFFTNTREQCDKLAVELKKRGVSFAIYRGEMDKSERRANLKSFRDGKVDYLISTDLASRGLDIELVGRVINYHMPQHLENYIHRVGRTARAGRRGLVVNFVTERDLPLVTQLESVKALASSNNRGGKARPKR